MLTQDIHKSWQRFKIGLTIFVVGVLLLFTLSHLHTSLYVLGLTVLFVGFVIAMFGYIGIFLARFSSLKNKKPPPKFWLYVRYNYRLTANTHKKRMLTTSLFVQYAHLNLCRAPAKITPLSLSLRLFALLILFSCQWLKMDVIVR